MKKSLNVSLDEELMDDLDRASEILSVSKSAIVSRILGSKDLVEAYSEAEVARLESLKGSSSKGGWEDG